MEATAEVVKKPKGKRFLSLRDKFNLKKAAGKIVTLTQHALDPTLKLFVSAKENTSIETTIEMMEEKIDQLVELPNEYIEKDPITGTFKIQCKLYSETQLTRTKMGNRVFAMFKLNRNFSSDTPKEETEHLAKKLINYNGLGKNINRIKNNTMNGKTFDEVRGPVARSKFLHKFAKITHEDDIIADENEFNLVLSYFNIWTMELEIVERFSVMLDEFPIWKYCLSNIYGLGPITGAMFVSHMDIHRSTSPGSFIRRCGITVESDGKGTSRRKEHNVPTEYLDKDGNLCYKMGLGYDPKWRSFFLYTLIQSFVYQKPIKSPYRRQYDNKKKQYSLRADLQRKDKKTKIPNSELGPDLGHIDKMAKRWLGKIFLCDVWLWWAALEGKEIKKPYYEAKINKNSHAGIDGWNRMVRRLGNPLDVREKLYGKRDPIPACYAKDIDRLERS